MSKNIYVGSSNVARKGKKVYYGVDNVARKVKKMYIGDGDNKARLCFDDSGCFVMVNDGQQSIVFSVDSGKTWDSFSIASSIGYFRPSVYYKGLFIGYASGEYGTGRGIYYISKEDIIAKRTPTLAYSFSTNIDNFYDGRFILKGNTLEFLYATHYSSDNENVYTIAALDSSDGRTWTGTGGWATKNFTTYPHIVIRHTTYFQNRYISLYAVDSASGSRYIYYSAENASFPQCLSSMTMSSSYITEGSPDFFETPTKILGAGLKKSTRYLVEYSDYYRGITKSSTAPTIAGNNLTISGGIPLITNGQTICIRISLVQKVVNIIGYMPYHHRQILLVCIIVIHSMVLRL